MSAPTEQRTRAPQTTTQPQDRDSAALNAALGETERRQMELRTSLEKDYTIATIEEVLPDAMKGQARRLVKRALLTFASNPSLRDCPNQEFIRCVLRAAEIGLAIDGRLCYVVNYRGKVHTWQALPDYKGLVAVAKRSGQISDCYGDVVCRNDIFRAFRDGPVSHLIHELPAGFGTRGEVIGAYAIVKMPDGDWRYELMDLEDLDRIRNRAPAKSGPWATDVNEMRKKTVIRRLLKMYCDDPAYVGGEKLVDEALESATAGNNGKQAAETRAIAVGALLAAGRPAPMDLLTESYPQVQLAEPAPAAPRERQPGEDDPGENETRADLEHDLSERLDNASTEAEFTAVGSDLTRHAVFLRDGHARLVAQYQARYRKVKSESGRQQPKHDPTF